MSNLIKTTVKAEDIKTSYSQPENSKDFLFTLGVLLKTIFPLEYVVVHKDTMQLIANAHYFQVALAEGKDEIEVILADFPKEHLLHAIATHWKPTKKFALMFKFIAVFMEYYALKTGEGAQYRKGMSDLTLRELVAEILGTNKTYLDWIEAIGNFRPELLDLVDSGEVSLKEAFAIVPKHGGSRRSNNSGGDGKGVEHNLKNYTLPVATTGDLSDEELETLTCNLPIRYSEKIGNGVIPDELSISKAFTYNDVLQGFSIVYEDAGKSVIINIVYTEELRATLLQAA